MCLLFNTPCGALNQYITTSVRKPGRKTDFYRNWHETDQSSFIIQAKRKCKTIKIKSKQTAQMVRRELRFLDCLLSNPCGCHQESQEACPPFPPGSPAPRTASGFCPAPLPPVLLQHSSEDLPS